MSDLFVWRCEKGHESVHSETAIRALMVYPRCPIRLGNGRSCWKQLVFLLRPLVTQLTDNLLADSIPPIREGKSLQDQEVG